MKNQRIVSPSLIVDGIEIPPIGLARLTENRPVRKFFKKIGGCVNFVGEYWPAFLVAGILFLWFVFGPIVDRIFAN